jgi:cytochrome P450
MGAGASGKSARLPPGRDGLPWLGETVSFMRDLEGFHRERIMRHGAIFRTHLLGKPTITVTGYEACLFVLTKATPHLNWSDGWPKTFHDLLGRSLFVQDGEEHKQKRKLLMNAFSGPAMRGYVPSMEDRIIARLEQWARQRSLTLLPAMKHLTFDIASDLLLGTSPGDDTAALSAQFNELTAGFFAFPVAVPFTTYGRAMRARGALLDHVGRAVAKSRVAPRRDALSLLVSAVDENGMRLSDEELKNQSILMLFAAHDTTTSFMLSALRALELHPDVLEQARSEQRALGISSPVTFERLAQMPYLDQILLEVERKYPPVPGAFRGVVKPLRLGDYEVPPGYRINYRVTEAHNDPEVFRHPERFDPARFGVERNEQKARRVPLFGFGAGPRVCLGIAFAKLEMKIMLSHILRHYTWQAEQPQDFSVRRFPMLLPRSGYRVRFAALSD